VRKEENPRGGVIKLTPIVTLNGLDGETELSRHPDEEVTNCGKALDLARKGKVQE
jgi:hypothetical protein